MRTWSFIAGLGAGLNLFDAGATFIELQHGLATEANPMMAKLYAINPLVFLGFKALAVLAFWLLAKMDDARARFALVATTMLYATIAFWHLFGV